MKEVFNITEVRREGLVLIVMEVPEDIRLNAESAQELLQGFKANLKSEGCKIPVVLCHAGITIKPIYETEIETEGATI